MSQAINPPSIYFNGINFNSSFYLQTTSSGFTEGQANVLYVKKTGSTSTGLQIFNGIRSTSINAVVNENTATDISTWINYDVLYQDMTLVGNSYKLFGYDITPTLNAIAFYPAVNTPIGLYLGFYNIQATFQLTGSASTGRMAFGVTTNSATGDWLYATNGNFVGNIEKTHIGTISSADLPLVFTLNFNAVCSGYLYFKYFIQSLTGSLLMNYQITRLG